MEKEPITFVQEVNDDLGCERRLSATIVSDGNNHFWIDTVKLWEGSSFEFETLVFPCFEVIFDREKETLEPGERGDEVAEFGRSYNTELDAREGHEEIVEDVCCLLEKRSPKLLLVSNGTL